MRENFDFGSANDSQKLAISTVNGPVLITAGPGTGKTYTLVQRAIFMIQECGVKPENIMIATFTEKAAQELITRMTDELAKRNIIVNINEMYIGTIHSICLRIIKENLEYTRLKKNFTTLDEFDQKYRVFQNIYRFLQIPNIENVVAEGIKWRQAKDICTYVNKLSEELVDFEAMKNDPRSEISAVGAILERYQGLLEEYNLIDFSAIQVESFRLLNENPAVLKELQKKIQYIMIDEYQDTNYIQEKMIFLLGGEHRNVCAVGDDDQGLYRFRGATIRNILEFPQKFKEGECKVIPLVVNYRSDSKIIDFYNEWMSTTDGKDFKFEWKNYRYPKTIVPHEKSELSVPSVIRISSSDDERMWAEKIHTFIKKLKDTGKIEDYNQIAFLFSSLKHIRVKALAKYLEDGGVNVYSPRSDAFFERDEIRLLIGCLMLTFPKYVSALENEEFKYEFTKLYEYYNGCAVMANKMLADPKNIDLLKWIRKTGKTHFSLSGNTDYAYSGLLYQMFAFEPFSKLIGTDVSCGVTDIRPLRNIALFTQIVGRFEHLHTINILTPKGIDSNTEKFFNLYLKLLFSEGVSEYEDDSEYAPSGCVSFLTIHQSKGLEFPIVLVDSLSDTPRMQPGFERMSMIEESYYRRPAFEPADMVKFFDFWRKYYTAFSRAQNLLVLTCDENSSTPSKYFREVYERLPKWNESFDFSEFKLKKTKDTDLKQAFSFTSHIQVYETCPLQYKFFNELEFSPIRVGAMMFGTLVHQTIEDIHRAVLRKEKHLVTNENIAKWFEMNYSTMVKQLHTHLSPIPLNAALEQVLRYAERQSKIDGWDRVQETEVDVSLVKPDYIIEGKIDLIEGENDTVEIIDFKAEKKPDVIDGYGNVELYRRQLQLYAHIIEERTGQKVSKMHIYYTGEEGGVPTITFPRQETAIEATARAFDDTVHKILSKDYNGCSASTKTCKACDFRYYCRKQ